VPTVDHPTIVQGGMGVGVSSWQLARAVAVTGQLGVVSGTAVAVTLARRLMDGDPEGHVRRALERFPDPVVVQRILGRYLREPEHPRAPYASVPQYTLDPPRTLVELTVTAAFVEVWLAKEGHDGRVGINLLEKIQLPTLPTLYGAMLAGVDDVFMGAGIPARVPAILDRLALHQPVDQPITVIDAERGTEHLAGFDPREVVAAATATPLQRPRFIAIVSSATLARYLMGVATGAPDGFVVEAPTAGGHNAPPRGKVTLSDDGEPVYGPRDVVDPADLVALGKPFWLAGGYAGPAALSEARSQGAAGVQVGTAFALCDESGLAPDLKRRLLDAVRAGDVRVHTDPLASPTGYPFKLVPMAGTIGDDAAYADRPRRCDLGYLREPYRRDDGHVGYRCPAEPVDDYVAKGGDPGDTVGRRCLCNGLVAAIDLRQRQPSGYDELPLVTAGDDLPHLTRLLADGRTSYTAADVIDHILAGDRHPVTGASPV
jgi:NAD(P)H-dependent flavin oxidoreductase YrpB (nitropropane dioxygenase family)